MKLWRVGADVSFADTLATHLLARTADNPLSLSDVLLLLPTRRACRTMHEAFLRQSGGKALLLPRMMPLGDLDADELSFASGVDVPPALSPRRRQLLLSRLIRQFQKDWPLAQCLAMAGALARFMDDVTSEGADLSRLDDLVQKREVAEHWQLTLNFLKPVLTAWPSILEAEGCIDGAQRRNLMLAAQAEHWRAHPPAFPVIAAGSTGSIPAIAAFLKCVLEIPTGEVVLPALPSWEEASAWWDAVDMTHPHYGLKDLLRVLGVGLAEIKPLSHETKHAPPMSFRAQSRNPERHAHETGCCNSVQHDVNKGGRLALLHHALLPAAVTGIWAEEKSVFNTVGIERIDCAHEQEEASVIALKMREVLETPAKTAVLVTPDRMLGRRVGEILRRWGLAIDDSAGSPLSKTAAAIFLRAVMDFASGIGGDDPVQFLSLLKHPLAAGGVEVSTCRSFVRWLDKYALRGVRPEEGFAGIRKRMAEAQALGRNARNAPEGLAEWLDRLEATLAPLIVLLRGGKDVPLVRLLDVLVQVGEALAHDGVAPSGAARLWKGAGGEALATWITDLRQASQDFPPVPVHEAPSVLVTLMQDGVVRPRQKDHPRLAILGPMEAQLQSADVVILAGLNEGVWPAPPSADPWMSRPMRVDFGLRPAEQRIGQEAHDFYALCAAREVVLTRSLRVNGTPTVPARWLQRLDVAAPALKHGEDHPLLLVARLLDAPERVAACSPPEPRPPLSARPRTLSVTEVETLQRDPYALYAKRILRLKKLDDLNMDVGVRERGTFVHAVLQRMLEAFPEEMPDREAAYQKMLTIGEEELEAAGMASVRAWWQPRFERLAAWFVDVQRERYLEGKPRWLEVKGALKLEPDFTVTARADRIDERVDGSLAIIDYKTGTLSTGKERTSGLSIQLPLEAAIARAGGFADVPARRVDALEFWKVTGGKEAGTIEPFAKKETAEECAERALRVLAGLIALYDDEATGYPSEPIGGVKYSDYRHLARVNEWSVAGSDEEGEE